MNDDGGPPNEPLSLIVIPPANEVDVAAGSSAHASSSNSTDTSNALNFPNTLSSDSQPQPPQGTSHSEIEIKEDTALQGHSDLVPIELVKHEDSMLDMNAQVEMVEPSSDGSGTSNDAGSTINDDEQEYYQGSDSNEMKRVKVYELVGSRWVDRGTAFCFGHCSSDGSEALLTARSEKNVDDVILTTTIRTNDVYQRQQDTLIVWTEPDGVDYALSFQDPEGCSEVWSFIVDVQRQLNGAEEQGSVTLGSSSPAIGSEPSSLTANIIRTGRLPTPHVGIIGDIDRAIKALTRTQQLKERICEYILAEDYIKQLVDVMHAAEEAESLESLHALCSLMQTILTLNDHSIYEIILDDELFLDVCGMLEYDPDFPTHKANFREFLLQGTRYHEPVIMGDPAIRRKIHHTYRLQFLKDVVLARVIDDSTFNVLNSYIIFNQIDIISHIQTDNAFLRDIVKLYVDEDILSGNAKKPPPPQPQQGPPIALNGDIKLEQLEGPPASPKLSNVNGVNGRTVQTSATSTSYIEQTPAYAFAPPEQLSEEDLIHRRAVIFLVQQLCIMGKNVQVPARMALFRTLVDRGVLFAVQWALGLSEKEPVTKAMIAAGGEILTALLDHDLNGVRGHVLKQVVAIEKERAAKKRGADKAETIIEMCCRIMAHSKDLAVQSQVGDALKVWLDVPLGNGGESREVIASGSEASQALASTKLNRKDDPGTERFMDYFYKECIGILFKPFGELPEWRNFSEPILPLTREQTNRYVYLCDLLYNFCLQHQFRSHFFVLSTNIVARVATILKAKDKHLRHASFRIFRLLLKQNNQNMHAQIMKHDILKPILDLTIRESRRDNLLSCSCQEYFEHMRRENMKDLIKFCMTHHEAEIKRLAETPLGAQRFEMFIRRWDMNNEPLPVETKSEKPIDIRGWPGNARALEVEEEDYFNGDDDDDESDYIQSISSQSWSRGTSSPIPGATNGLKRKRRMAVAGALANRGIRPPLGQGQNRGVVNGNELPRKPLLGSLVDYEDEEGSESPTASMAANELPPLSPKLSHRQVPGASLSNGLSSGPPPPRRQAEDEDEEDNMLEALLSRSRPQSPAPGMMLNIDALGPMKPGEKRRRADEDEEDEELLNRLTVSKKVDFGSGKDKQGGQDGAGFARGHTRGGGISISLLGRGGKSKTRDDPPPATKKIKLKIGSLGQKVGGAKESEGEGEGEGAKKVLSSSTTATGTAPASEPGAKDGDTG